MRLFRLLLVPSVAMAICGMAVQYMWGFTVDDVLIVARYSHNIAIGAGHSFSEGSPASDGVTPIALPWLLAPFARSSTLSAFEALRWVGMLLTLASVALIAVANDQRFKRERMAVWASLVMLSLTPAIAAWASAGLETPIAMFLCTSGVVIGLRPTVGRLTASVAFAGLAAMFRPELAGWAGAVAIASFAREADLSRLPIAQRLGRFASLLSLAIGPLAGTLVLRYVCFGWALPLASLAKPPSIELGLMYVTACVLLLGLPLAVFAPWTWRRCDPYARWLLVAAGVHVVCVALVGGDWMPLSRLFVPILPSLAFVFASLGNVLRGPELVVRSVLCLASHVWVVSRVQPDASLVWSRRQDLISQGAASFGREDVVAAVDIGWIGASYKGRVVDLAGITDPVIASLPGSHTSKSVHRAILENKGVDVLVLLQRSRSEDAWESCSFARQVEVNLCLQASVRAEFAPARWLDCAPSLRYLVLRRRSVSQKGS